MEVTKHLLKQYGEDLLDPSGVWVNFEPCPM